MSLYSEAMDKIMEHEAAIYAAQQKANQMTTELTLREKVVADVCAVIAPEGDRHDAELALIAICAALDATGVPAYIRVADDLRGEWEPARDTDVNTPTTQGD